MIEFKNVTKKFRVKNGILTAVNHVNLKVNSGEIYGIIGYSGAGKSTLVKMLNGLEVPTHGGVIINHQNISKLNQKQLRQQRHKIGTVFQHFNLLWSRTILQNVALPLEIAGVKRSKRRQRALKLLKLVDLQDRADDYPVELSGGQKQRVGIARALANRPKLLISDEATSALDPETTDQILDLLLKINRQMGLTIILITHEMHAIRKVANKVAVMEKGSIVERGPVVQVFNHPKRKITRRFVNEDSNSDADEVKMTLAEILKRHPNGDLVRLTFNGQLSQQPIVSGVIRKYPELRLNILGGNIKPFQNGSVGSLLIQLLGGYRKAALADFEKLNVRTEVLRRG